MEIAAKKLSELLENQRTNDTSWNSAPAVLEGTQSFGKKLLRSGSTNLSKSVSVKKKRGSSLKLRALNHMEDRAHEMGFRTPEKVVYIDETQPEPKLHKGLRRSKRIAPTQKSRK